MIRTKYCITLLASFLSWIIPVNIPHTPKPIVAFSFLASGCGYLYALSLATPLADKQWFDRNQKIQEREVLTYDFALGEIALKQALELQYLGQAEVEKEPVVVEAGQQQLAKPKEQKLLPDALPDGLKTIIEIVKSNGGTITQRELARKTKLKADQIQTAFRELQQRGYGNITTDGRTYTFTLTRQA